MAVSERTGSDAEQVDVEEMRAKDIDGSFVPRPKPEVTGVEVEGEAVLIIEEKWTIHWLNQISTVVWESLDGVASLEEIAGELSRSFGADLETVLDDVIEVTRQFGMTGFLEGVAEEAPKTGPQGIAEGEELPPFELPDLEGQPVTLESFRGEQLLLVNWSPVCGFCRKIAPELAEAQTNLQERGIRPVYIAIGGPDANREFMAEFGLEGTLLLQESHEAEVFFGLGTPVAYLVDEEGKAASELAYGADAVPVLVRSAAGLPEKPSGDGAGNTHKH